MTERGGIQGLMLRLSLLLLLLGFASLQLQGWVSRKAVDENPSQKVSQKSARSERSVKHKTLVVGEATGQGVPGRIQCRDASIKNGSVTNMEAIKQRLVRKRPCLFSEKETVIFVTLFVEPEADAAHNYSSEQVEEKRTTLRKMKKGKLHALLSIFLESIQVSMPDNSRVMIITNQIKVKGELPQKIDWIPIPRDYSRGNLMVQRLESYIDLLERMIGKRMSRSASPTSHLIFSDFDVIVVDDLGCVFKEFPFFDVALTFRNNWRQPINSGVIMVRGTLESMLRGKLLLKEVVKVYRAKFRHAFGVLGDQLALADVVRTTVRATRFQEVVPFEASVMATKTLFLPCAIYNWTPSEGAGQFHGMPAEVKVLHFKGSRKRLMVEAWSFYKQLGVPDLSSMQCLVLRSGRSRYDY